MSATRTQSAKRRRGGAIFKILGVLLAIGILFTLQAVFEGIKNRYKLSQQKQASSAVAPDSQYASTEEMWNRLTAARIKLDDEAATPSEAKTTAAVRPEWVDKAPARVGDVYRVVVNSEPFSTVDECYAQLEQRFPVEVERRLADLVPKNQQRLLGVPSLDELGVTLDYIMRKICRQEYTQSMESSVGEMKRVYVLMEFTPDVEANLLGSWQAYQQENRLTIVGKIAALVLASLGSIYGLLRLDTATRGYYTNRLIAGTSAVIIAIAAALFVR